jgi:hypothetical protein
MSFWLYSGIITAVGLISYFLMKKIQPDNKWYKWYALVIWLIFIGIDLFRVICC